jgi:RNA polymerase sigma factor (sigma-70 family)
MDHGPLTIRQRHLVHKTLPLAHKFGCAVARRCGLGRDEATSDVVLQLMQAARRFDPSRGVKFLTYAFGCLKTHFSGSDGGRAASSTRRRELLYGDSAARRAKSRGASAAFDGFGDGFVEPRAPRSPAQDGTAMDLEWYAAKLRAWLTPTEYEVVYRKLALQQTLQEIAPMVKKTRSRVQQIYARAVAKLRAMPESEAVGEVVRDHQSLLAA